jgi:Flp pilus assembly protein TadG
MRLPKPRPQPQSGRWTAGSAAVEFALIAPILLVLAVGLADYATLAGQTSALTAATRAGAEYARAKPTDTTGGANNAVTSFMAFAPAATATSTTFCTCTDGTTVSCPQPGQSAPQANPCSAKTDPRVLQYVSVAAQQSPSTLAFAGLSLPTTLSVATYLRWQ